MSGIEGPALPLGIVVRCGGVTVVSATPAPLHSLGVDDGTVR